MTTISVVNTIIMTGIFVKNTFQNTRLKTKFKVISLLSSQTMTNQLTDFSSTLISRIM